MSSIPAAAIDPSRRLDLYARVKRVGSKKFTFLDSTDDPVDISAFGFEFKVYEFSGAYRTKLNLTVGSGLAVSGSGNNELTVSFTAANLNMREGEYFYELYKSSTSKTYLNGKFILNVGLYDGIDTETTTLTIDDSGEVQITIADTVTDEIPLVTFATSLTFDFDKDLSTVSGGTRTFTLAASGHLNGVGIVARVNEPVAINFPVAFELVSGSDSVSTTDMNIIIFRYFEDYDGLGTDKVLYTIKNQTAI